MLEELGMAAGTGIINNVFDLAFAKPKQKMQLDTQKKALAQSNDAQMDIWNRTNYSAQVEQMKKAGINPALLYGMSGGGGTTTGSPNGSVPSFEGAHGMDIAGATQLALVRAQTENIQADTAKKRAEATKTAGVDTELGYGQIASLAQQTQNAVVQKQILEVDKRIKDLQEGILDSTQYYEMGQALEQWRKLAGEAREAAARGQVAANTTEEMIRQESIRTAGMLIENRAKQKGIELTDAQIAQISNQMNVALRDSVTNQWNAETNAKRVGIEIQKTLTASGVEMSADEIVQIILGLGAAAQFGKGGVGKPKANPGSRYNKWGTKTSPKGYNLK